MSLPTPLDRETLRRTLRASLSDVLNEIALDAPGVGMAATFPSGRSALAPQVASTRSFGVSPFSGPFIPSFQKGLFGQSVNFPPVLRATDSGIGIPAKNLLLQNVVAEKCLIEQAKAALLAQEQRRVLQESYLCLLRSNIIDNVARSTPPTHKVTRSTETPKVDQQLISADKAANALEALGSNLRSNSDPYIDVSNLEDPDPRDSSLRRARGGVAEPFPDKLHRLLQEVEDTGKTDIISFFSHGRAFAVHDVDRFVNEIMPKYFKQSKWHSFARQLNLYGFIRITSGPDAGGYYHELFLKGRPHLSLHMRRVGVPQGEDRRKLRAKVKTVEPDFYSMKPLSSKP